MPFDGFPRNVRATPVPDPLFNSLLEEIEDLAELKVTLRLVWLLGQKRGQFRFVHESELLRDGILLRSFRSMGGETHDRIKQGLNLALTRGTLLRHSSDEAPGDCIYFLNTEDNRRRLQSREGLTALSRRNSVDDNVPPELAASRVSESVSSIYDLYENNIGTIGPLMAEQLAEAEERYPPQWIEEAFKLATFDNRRSWRYIAAILRRWAAEGRGGYNDSPDERQASQPGTGVNAGATLWEADGRQHGESGRHSEEDNRTRQYRSRQRR